MGLRMKERMVKLELCNISQSRKQRNYWILLAICNKLYYYSR